MLKKQPSFSPLDSGDLGVDKENQTSKYFSSLKTFFPSYEFSSCDKT